MKIKKAWFVVLIVSIVVLFLILLLVLPRIFDKKWQFWGNESSSEVIPSGNGYSSGDIISPNDPSTAKKTGNPGIPLFLKYPDADYVYISQSWEMSFGNVYGIELNGPGFERINESPSTVSFIVPNGYEAILYVDGLGEDNKAAASFLDGSIVFFDKGNPTMVGDSTFIPEGTIINIWLEGNDSSGVLVVLSPERNLLQKEGHN